MSYFRPEVDAMAGYVPGEQPQAGKFIKLNTNENPYPPSPAVATAVEQALSAGLGRYPDAMATAFRTRAAEVHGVDPDWILCGNGSDDILTILTRAMVPTGARLRLPYPSYILYNTLAKIQGAQSEEIPFNAGWTLSDDFAKGADDLRLVFLPNPNSPSGTVVSKQEILELAGRLSCPLLVDEAYADFAEFNCIDLVHQADNILVSRTMSKSYGLAGIRFGYVIAQPHIIAGLSKVKDSYNCDSLSIAAATAAIDDQAWLAENRSRVIATRERLTGAMRGLGFTVVDSQANFVWCTDPDRPLQPFYEKLKASRVLVRYMNYNRAAAESDSAGMFSAGEGLRISVGTDDQIDACIQLLKAMM